MLLQEDLIFDYMGNQDLQVFIHRKAIKIPLFQVDQETIKFRLLQKDLIRFHKKDLISPKIKIYKIKNQIFLLIVFKKIRDQIIHSQEIIIRENKFKKNSKLKI